MCNVVDPLGGSYYVEALTQQLVDKAQEIIDRVEREGGMAKAVAAGWPKAMIEEAAAARQARVDRGDDVIVGVNKYRLKDEDLLETLEVDNTKVREAQVARINRVKASRDEVACRAALTALRRAAAATQSIETNLLAHAVDAARARATLGEISSAMEESFRRYATQPTPVKGVYAAPYEGDARWQQVLDGVAAVERRMGRKPKLLVAKMGQDGTTAARTSSRRRSATWVLTSCRGRCSRRPRKRWFWRSKARLTSSARRALRRGTRHSSPN